MDGQQIAVVVVVAGAALYVLRSIWRSIALSGKDGCGNGCGHCATPAKETPRPGMIPLEQVRVK
jgi:hypothetical protein